MKKNTKKESIWSVFKNALKSFWAYIIKPIKDQLEAKKKRDEIARIKKEEEDSIKNLKKNFESKFNVNIDKSKAAMYSQKQQQTNNEYLTSKIVEARKYMNENGITPGGGQMTDIKKMDEHNTNGGYTNKTLNEVIRQDNELAKKNINGINDKELKQKAKLRWISRD